MRKNLFIFVLIVLITNVAFQANAEVGIGSTIEEVLAEFGKPNGELTSGKERILSYPGGIITIRDNKVVHIDDNFIKRLQLRKQENQSKGVMKNFQDAAKQKRDIWGNRARQLSSGEQTVDVQKIVIVSNGGKSVDLSELMVLGHVTVIDFYADWCGPCKKIAPLLEELVQSNEDVYLRKININDWNTPVAQQYSIRSIPDIRVFDRQGRLVGSPTSSFQDVQLNIQKAKQR
ncbi:MAG: thioredoxin family protein [Candidatus Omnitrophica bacterium]|nr:thioredoxin family protein [Candidatus Omnitrophota bacterium]